jgi:hypothetical protein
MFGSRFFAQAAVNTNIVIQERGRHADRHYVCVGENQYHHEGLHLEGDLLLNKKFLEILSQNYQGNSIKASDCTLTTEDHARFSKKLPELENLHLERGKITNVALNALIGNCPKLRNLSLIGEDMRSGPVEQVFCENELPETPEPLKVLQGKRLETFDLKGYSTRAGILNYIKGVIIGRLVLTPRLIDFDQLDEALGKSTVEELEFDAWCSAPVKPPMGYFPHLNAIKSMRFLNHDLKREELDALITGFGNQMTVLDLSSSRELKTSDLDLLSYRCPKLCTLSLFDCHLISNEDEPMTISLLEKLETLVKKTPVQHIILGWDNDKGDPTYRNGPDPRGLIQEHSMSGILSKAANRQVNVTVTNWYPKSQTLKSRL